MKFIVLITSLGITLWGGPAMPMEMDFNQADGSSFRGNLIGDEYMHWVKSKKGDILIYNNKTKNYDYGTIKKINSVDELVASGVKYQTLKFSTRDSSVPKIDEKVLHKLWKNKRETLTHH